MDKHPRRLRMSRHSRRNKQHWSSGAHEFVCDLPDRIAVDGEADARCLGAVEFARVAGRGRAPEMRITARSVPALVPTSLAGCVSPEASVTKKRFALPTTCAFVTTSPRVSKTTPEPRATDVRTCTTSGETALTILTKLCCNVLASSAAATGTLEARSSAGAAPAPPQAATARPMREIAAAAARTMVG